MCTIIFIHSLSIVYIVVAAMCVVVYSNKSCSLPLGKYFMHIVITIEELNKNARFSLLSLLVCWADGRRGRCVSSSRARIRYCSAWRHDT